MSHGCMQRGSHFESPQESNGGDFDHGIIRYDRFVAHSVFTSGQACSLVVVSVLACSGSYQVSEYELAIMNLLLS